MISSFPCEVKTTLPNELIVIRKNRQLFIIEEKFSSEGIDAKLVAAPHDDIFEFNNG